jgi:hypothetical protein
MISLLATEGEFTSSRSEFLNTDDSTAFDVVIRYTTDADRRGFIAFEGKYIEVVEGQGNK